MAITHTWGVTVKTDAGTVASTTAAYTSDAEVNVVEPVAAVTTNKEIDVVVTKANIISCVMISDKDVTVKTNSSATPAETITLAAGKQVGWNTDQPAGANPFSTNLTKLFVTNAGSTTATFKFYCLLDQAP